MELKELLKEARKQTGMTQKQFAAYFRIPYRTLEDWERGDRVQIKKKSKIIYRFNIIDVYRTFGY